MTVHPGNDSLFIEIETDAGYKAICIDHVASLVENKLDGTGQINFKENGYLSLNATEWPIFISKWQSCLGWLDEWRANRNG